MPRRPSETKRSALVSELQGAFETVVYPGDAIIVREFPQSTFAYWESQDVANAFRGRAWRDVDLETLRHHAGDLDYLTPEALRYYLVAYLVAAIKHYESSDPLPYQVIFVLTRPDEAKDASRARLFQAFVDGLTDRQRQGVRMFLEYLRVSHPEDYPPEDADLDEAGRALALCWSQW